MYKLNVSTCPHDCRHNNVGEKSHSLLFVILASFSWMCFVLTKCVLFQSSCRIYLSTARAHKELAGLYSRNKLDNLFKLHYLLKLDLEQCANL